MIVNFRLKVGRDDEIIRWINCLGEHDRSYHIREILRGYLRGDSSETNSNPSHATSSPSCVSIDKDSVNDMPQNININSDIENLDNALNGWLKSV